MSQSDLVFHAEGPGAAQGLPWISALNWLASTAEANLRRLSAALIDLRGADGEAISRKLDLRLSGLAPGSLWMGIKTHAGGRGSLSGRCAWSEPWLRKWGAFPEIIRFIDELANRMAVLLGHLRDRVDAKLQELTKAIRPSGLELEKLKGYSSWRPYPAA